MQEKEHRQRQMGRGDENEERPQEQSDPAASAFDNSKKG